MYITFCCHYDDDDDDYGKVICVKLNVRGLNVLSFGCYFPSNDHSAEYIVKLASIVGFIKCFNSIWGIMCVCWVHI